MSIDRGIRFRQSVLNLVQDTFFSACASLLTILLLRWINKPVLGFTKIVLIWLSFSLAASLIGSFVTGSHKTVNRYATVKSVSAKLATVLVKELLLLVIVLIFGHLVYDLTPGLVVLAIVADFAFSASALLYPVIIARNVEKRKNSDIRLEVSRPNALVYGTGEESFMYALKIKGEGKYNILGLLSPKKDDNGLVVGDFVVYYAKDGVDINDLSWKLGGVDCVFYPKSASSGNNPDDDSFAEERHEGNMTLAGRVLKRGFDLCLSFILIVVFLPAFVACAIAVKLEDGGPVLFKQERLGKNGKHFFILKFRSMVTDAEAAGAMLYSGENDPRLTKVGAFLRVHHLDELPQLLNVFIGDMSFVGYRPERPCYIEQISDRNPRYSFLYQIRPGVTSYATLYNGYTDTLEKMMTRLDLDLYYLRHHSVSFDLKVLWLTFFSIVLGKKF